MYCFWTFFSFFVVMETHHSLLIRKMSILSVSEIERFVRGTKVLRLEGFGKKLGKKRRVKINN